MEELLQGLAVRLSQASRQSLACCLDTVYTMYHKLVHSKLCVYTCKYYCTLCLYLFDKNTQLGMYQFVVHCVNCIKPQARHCLLASDNLTAKLCYSIWSSFTKCVNANTSLNEQISRNPRRLSTVANIVELAP